MRSFPTVLPRRWREGWESLLKSWVLSPSSQPEMILFLSPDLISVLRRERNWLGSFLGVILVLNLWVIDLRDGAVFAWQIVGAILYEVLGCAIWGLWFSLEIDRPANLLRRSWGILGWRSGWLTREEALGNVNRVQLQQVDPERKILGSYRYRIALTGPGSEVVLAKDVGVYWSARLTAEEFSKGLGFPIDDPGSLGESLETPATLPTATRLRLELKGSSARVTMPRRGWFFLLSSPLTISTSRDEIQFDHRLFGFRRLTRVPCANVTEVLLEPNPRGWIVLRTKERFFEFGKHLPGADKQWIARLLRFVAIHGSGEPSSDYPPIN